MKVAGWVWAVVGWCALALSLLASAPAQAQAGAVGTPIAVCLKRVAPDDRPLSLLARPAGFDCSTNQRRWGAGDYWVLSEPVRIPRQSEALYLLQRIRDEAHRFAITYHRQLRDKRMTTSVLDGIPGLGPTRQKRLRKELGGVAGVRAASLADLKALPWLPDPVATAVHEKVHAPPARLSRKPTQPVPFTGEYTGAMPT